MTRKCHVPFCRAVGEATSSLTLINISHEFILEKIEGLPGRDVIRKWMKAGYVEGGKYYATNAGTPQGGIISPLLANIALDGLQELLTGYEIKTVYFTIDRDRRITKRRKEEKYKFARYADDFVVMSQEKEYLEEILPIIQGWLKERGLELNEDKTTIKSIRNEGFSFLGVDIRQLPTKTLRRDSNRFHRKSKELARNAKPKPGAKRVRLTPNAKFKDEDVYSCIIKPGKKETNELLLEIREYLKGAARSQNFESVIQKLNSKLRGWLNYHRYFCSKRTFTRVRYEVLDAIYRYLRRKHPQKSWKWIHEKYYKTVDIQAALQAWAASSKRPLVLFIDEIDSLQDETLMSVLRQLRDGYRTRPKNFPLSVGLIGLRDVRDYKFASGGSETVAGVGFRPSKLLNPKGSRLNTSSPFNIKVSSLTLRNFNSTEVQELYHQHTEDTGQVFTDQAIDIAFDLTIRTTLVS